MSGHVLLGPFLTRSHAARRTGLAPEVIRHRPDLLRIRSRWLPETYFAFQFDKNGVRTDVGSVVATLRGRFDDLEIADWLVTPNTELQGSTPLRILNSGGRPDRVIAAAAVAGPHTTESPAHPVDPAQPAREGPAPRETGRARRPREAGFGRTAPSH